MHTRTWILIGVAVALVALGAYVSFRYLTFDEDEAITWLAPIDEHRAIAGRNDYARDRLQLSLVDEQGQAAWSTILSYGDTEPIKGHMVDNGSWTDVDPAAGLVTVGLAIAFGLDDGRERWRGASPFTRGLRMARIHQGQIIAVGSEPQPAVVALDASTGAEIWRVTAATAGLVKWYRLFDDALLIVGGRAVLVDLKTGDAGDAGLGDVTARGICSIDRQVYAVARAGAVATVEIGTGEPRTLSADLGSWLCPQRCEALGCAHRGDRLVLAASRYTDNAVLPTTVRLLALDPATGAEAWRLELPAGSRPRATSGNRFADFVPLRNQAPRFVPFRIANQLIMVDLDEHRIAWTAPGSRASNGWSLLEHEGTYYARDEKHLGAYDGETGKLVASVNIGVAQPSFAGDRIWLAGFSRHNGTPAIGQLSAHNLAPRPGSEKLVWSRREGAWVDGW